jgi:hypothetical protein
MIIAANVGQNMGVVMPTAGQVADGVVYGWPDTRTGTLNDPPDAPVITGVVDNLDGDSVTVSITGTDLIQLYYRQRNTSSWTTGNTRLASGDIVQGGLIAGTWYEMYATADNGAESAPSNLVTVYLASVTGAGTIKTAVYAILSGDSNLTALVGDRISPGGDPEDGEMSVVYYMISTSPTHTQDGPDTFTTPTLQINSYGASDLEAENVANAVKAVIDGFSGSVDGVSISYIAMNDEGDLDDFEPENRKLSRHGVRQDYLTSYTRN